MASTTRKRVDLSDEAFLADLASNAIMSQLRKREPSFKGGKLEMALTAIAMDPDARFKLETLRDRFWQDDQQRVQAITYAPELIIGTGPNGTTYANVRTAIGKRRPLVVEQADRVVVGPFGVARTAVYHLNSRNRAGQIAPPGENGGLNVIPGAPIQPENISAKEFQTNSDLAFVCRSGLLRSADVRLNSRVSRISVAPEGQSGLLVTLEDGGIIRTDRVIDARGLGDPIKPAAEPISGYMDFNEFMRKLEEPFPFEGLRRVAVIGSGDSAKCTVEALLGIGPSQHFSVPMLDWIERIDWYGDTLVRTCDEWRMGERGRYQALGSYLRTEVGVTSRVRVFRTIGNVGSTLSGVLVNGRLYDLVVGCSGWNLPRLTGVPMRDLRFVTLAGFAVATRIDDDSLEYYRVGPAASLPFQDNEPEGTKRLPENRVALFRLIPKTAQLACFLPGPSAIPGDVLRPGVRVTL